jgi:hypothetical protein
MPVQETVPERVQEATYKEWARVPAERYRWIELARSEYQKIPKAEEERRQVFIDYLDTYKQQIDKEEAKQAQSATNGSTVSS